MPDVETEGLSMRREEPQMTVLNKTWPQRIEVTLALLAKADSYAMTINFDTLNLRFANGRASYRVMEWNPKHGTLVCELTSAEGPAEGPPDE